MAHTEKETLEFVTLDALRRAIMRVHGRQEKKQIFLNDDAFHDATEFLGESNEAGTGRQGN